MFGVLRQSDVGACVVTAYNSVMEETMTTGDNARVSRVSVAVMLFCLVGGLF